MRFNLLLCVERGHHSDCFLAATAATLSAWDWNIEVSSFCSSSRMEISSSVADMHPNFRRINRIEGAEKEAETRLLLQLDP